MPASSSSSHQGSTTATATTTPTSFLYFLICWVVLAAFNYGFGISELNPLQSVISCKDVIHFFVTTFQQNSTSTSTPTSNPNPNPLPSCIPMTDAQFGAITALFTLGGLVTSLLTSPISSRFSLGPKSLLLISSTLTALGGGLQSMAGGIVTLGFGRAISGAGAGVGVVTVPRYLSDISPPSLRGSIGVLNQLAIVFGILTGQSLGVSSLGSNPTIETSWYLSWRAVPLISSLVALIQLITGLTIAVDPPSWIRQSGHLQKLDKKDIETKVKKVESRLWSWSPSRNGNGNGEEEVGLLENENENGIDENSGTRETSTQLTISELLSISFGEKSEGYDGSSNNPYKKGLSMILFTQIFQQLGGVNAVLYFSTGILTNVLSDGKNGGFAIGAKEVGVVITIVNVLMTFPPIFLIPENRLGRKSLLLLSLSTMTISSFFLSISILTSSSILSSIFIIFFVAGFSIGLGPIPFLILPELIPQDAINAASSLGIGLNWTANFFLALGFLPLKNLFKEWDRMDGGSVFFCFTLINSFSFWGIWKFYRYEERSERRVRVD